ncbi:MAG: ribonuclease P protein component [Saprospiraceae bacterium]
MNQFTLSRQERLSSKKDIDLLFTEPLSLTKYPIRLVWRELPIYTEAESPVRAMFSVSKKKFAKAVDRNRAKRLMKESYRLIKPALFEMLPAKKSFHLALLYTGNELLDFVTIQKSLATALERWTKKCQQE